MMSRSKLSIALGAILALALLAAGTTLHVLHGERSARFVAAKLLEVNALGIENALNRQLLQADRELADLPMVLTVLVEAGQGLQQRTASSLLQALNSRTSLFRDLALIDRSGTLWASSTGHGSTFGGGIDPAILGADEASGSSRLIGPILDPGTREWSMFLTRPIAVPGQGGMLAVAEMSVSTLLSLIAQVGLDSGAGIVVEKRSGEVIATLPYEAAAIGTARQPAASMRGQLNVAFVVPGASPKDDTLAVVRQATLGDVFISSTNPFRLALTEWHAERDRAMWAATAGGLLILILTGILLWLIHRSERLAEERARVTTLLESAIGGMSDGFVMWDADDRMITCNEVYRDLYVISKPFLLPGITFEEVVRRGAELGQYPGAEGRVDEFVAEVVAWHRGGQGAIERLLPDGRWLLISERRMANGGIVGTRTDITALKAVQAELAATSERAERTAREVRDQNARLEQRDLELHIQVGLFQAALDNMSHGLLMVDSHEHLIVANPRFADLFGIDAAQLVPGIDMERLREEVAAVGLLDDATLEELRRQQSTMAASKSSGLFVVTAASGQVIAVTQRPLADGGWIAIYEDFTSQRQAERRIRYLAHHDDLTNLPNRTRFRAEIESRMDLLRRGVTSFALFYIDLDRFKDVNDTYGHPTGDALLREVAHRLQACAGDDDLVARLGGDEFALVSAGRPAEALDHLAEEIIRTMAQPFDLLGRNLRIGASVGIGIASFDDIEGEEVLKRADLALYQAKFGGRGKACLFEDAFEERRRNRVLLERDIRDAIERNEFSVVYQPIFDLTTNRVAGFEALVRWHHASRGWIGPDEFIPVAEEAGLVHEIGAWVLRTACRDIAQLPGAVRVAVNLSAEQLRNDEIVGIVADTLRSSGLAAGRLELEITETALLIKDEVCADVLERLSDLGLRIALDDFGTGYSSLSHLRQFPLDKIKIDKSFVREMTSNRESAAIVGALAGLAAELGMTTTAEGIETLEQLQEVRSAGCTEAQGYLLGRPVSILHAVEMLTAVVPVELKWEEQRLSS